MVTTMIHASHLYTYNHTMMQENDSMACPQRPPTLPEPVPMDIDATRKRHQTPVVCHRCGKPGHYAKDCEKRFDIRYMLAEEKQEWLQNFALEADTPELKEEEEEPEVDPPPDFRSRSE